MSRVVPLLPVVVLLVFLAAQAWASLRLSRPETLLWSVPAALLAVLYVVAGRRGSR